MTGTDRAPAKGVRCAGGDGAGAPSVTLRAWPWAGFTLVELAVVIAILGLVVMLVAPRLPSTEEARLRGSARILASSIRYLADRAAATKTAYRLVLDLNGGPAAVTEGKSDGSYSPSGDPFLAGSPVADGVMVSEVVTPRGGRRSTGQVSLDFGLDGLREFTTIHLGSGRGGQYTVVAYPGGRKVKVMPGYREESL